ncbi:MAG TPA: hypothetical protein DEQ65_07555 [Ruminococcaceae bacterium]|nr:hypothetical protein [Oscillospiraceae bacterium]
MILNHSEEAKKYQQFYKEQLLKNVVPFWINSDLLDREYGGYISSVDREGKSYNNDKSVWFQGRCLWTFSTLCEKYGIREEWRKAANSLPITMSGCILAVLPDVSTNAGLPASVILFAAEPVE